MFETMGECTGSALPHRDVLSSVSPGQGRKRNPGNLKFSGANQNTPVLTELWSTAENHQDALSSAGVFEPHQGVEPSSTHRVPVFHYFLLTTER